MYGGPLRSSRRFIFRLHVRTSTTSTFARRTRRANVDVIDVRTWSQKLNPRDDRNGPLYECGVFDIETMLGYYCLVSSHFLLKDYTSALKYLDVIKVIFDCSLTTFYANLSSIIMVFYSSS